MAKSKTVIATAPSKPSEVRGLDGPNVIYDEVAFRDEAPVTEIAELRGPSFDASEVLRWQEKVAKAIVKDTRLPLEMLGYPPGFLSDDNE
jgi:hypothetical protein